MTKMAQSDITGSWFNAGYHGHFRSKSRSDFMCEYRYLAQPPPPKTFNKRTTEPATKHTFSRHDNRHSFMNDALYFEEGMGRRRIRNSTNKLDPDLLVWMPQKKEFQNSGPKTSCYKVDYGAVHYKSPKQQLVTRPKTSFDDDRLATTSYRYAHGVDNPNRPSVTVMKNVGLTTIPNRRQKASLGATRDTVAGCLSWHVARTRPTIPMSTQTTNFEAPNTSVEITEICPKTAPAALSSPVSPPSEVQPLSLPPATALSAV